jgi:phage shock protein E
MINTLKRWLGITSVDFVELMKNGAKVIDVRTPQEFAGGHITGAVNIPLDQLGRKVGSLNKEQTYLLCCRSGMRSASATSQLKAMGFKNVHNAGSWTSLKETP